MKVAAVEEGLPVLQPEQPNDPGFTERLRTSAPDLGVVVAYGHLLRRPLLTLPPRGMVNVHASLLPALRGAAPIEHAILQGCRETGVSIMQMDEGLDTGPVIHQRAATITPEETGGELEARLAESGAEALVEAITLMASGSARAVPQDDTKASYAPKITRQTARIRWEADAETIARAVRAFDPKPGAWTTLHGRDIKLFGPRLAATPPTDGAPGEIMQTDPAVVVATGEGALRFLEVQPAGRPRMTAGDWLRGRGAAPGDRFR